MGGGLLTREQIFKAPTRTYQEVPCAELGGKIRLQSLTGEEFEAWTESNRDPKKKNPDGTPVFITKGSTTRLLVRSMVDGKGNRLMSDDDASALAQISAAVLNRLGAAALKLNGAGESGVEEAVKNSGTAQEDASPLD